MLVEEGMVPVLEESAIWYGRKPQDRYQQSTADKCHSHKKYIQRFIGVLRRDHPTLEVGEGYTDRDGP